MDFDSIVIGAGVVGLAVARATALTGRRVLVLERHGQIGTETSARNSEVIHAGIYYPGGSLKAQLCVRGRQLLYDYCASHGVSHRRTGKLIVATEPGQEARLDSILAQGLANGVHDLCRLTREELLALEPDLNATSAILSPSTGIIDSHGLMLALQGDIERAGGIVCCHTPVEAVHSDPDHGRFLLRTGGNDPAEISCRELVNCAGHNAPALSRCITGAGSVPAPTPYLSKGSYFGVARRLPFRHLIYPMPSNEGLGVHLTLDLAGNARFGPDTQWVDAFDYRVDAARCEGFYDAIRRYYPDLRDGELVPAYAGIRPKIAGPGEPAADFRIDHPGVHGIPGYIALYGIESPGLTASLAIAEHVSALLDTPHARTVITDPINSQQREDYENSDHR